MKYAVVSVEGEDRTLVGNKIPGTIAVLLIFVACGKRVLCCEFHTTILFELDEQADYLASNLPYGKQRKLEIARAMATEPKLLLLDEPAAGMNPNETEELMNTIRFVRDRFNLTILLIEHDMKLVSGICEEIYVLNFGRELAKGETSEVLKNPEVITAYLGE